MGLFGSSDPVAQQEKLINKEAKHEEKSLKQAVKDVAKAEKEEHKAAKAETHSHSAVEKAHKVEEKAASKLNAATHKHDSAVSKQTAAEHELQAKADAHQRAAAALEQKKANLDNLQKSHNSNEAVRANKLQDLHPNTDANPTLTGATAAGGLDKHYANQGYGNNVDGTAGQVGQPGVVHNAQPVGTGYDNAAVGSQPAAANGVYRA